MRTVNVTYGPGGYHPLIAGGNVVKTATVVQSGLNADTLTLRADGVDVATLHYAGPETSAAWDVEGTGQTLAMSAVAANENVSPDPLNESVLEVTATTPGTIAVTCNGQQITLTAV